MRHNKQGFAHLKLRQKVAVDISQRSIKSSMLGQSWTMPVGIAPTGLAGMQWAEGEILGAQAAEAFGVPFILSTMSICSIEDVAAATTKPFWFQLYVMKDRKFIESLIDRAKHAGCSALVLTVDLQILGQRHRDIKNAMTAPPQLTLKNILNMMTKPHWCYHMLQTDKREFRNIIGHAQGVEDLSSLGAWSAQQLDPTLNWADVAWIKERWNGPLIIKGIMDADDARRAEDTGADAIIVSNHGGRQLDGTPGTVEVLPSIKRAVSDVEVFMDGGITTGQDVFKARALGAQGTFIGKAFLNGLGAMGKDGVNKCLELIANELDLTMAFCGYTDINQVDEKVIWKAKRSQKQKRKEKTNS